MTERLRGIVSIDLGPKNEPEIERGLRLEMAAERVTSTDRQLTASMDSTRIVRAGGRDMLEHSIRTGRLRKLESLGLAEELERGRWHLSEQLEPVLRAISDRTEMLKTIEQVLSGAGLERPHADRLVYRSQDGTVAIGRVLSCVPAEGVDDQGYMVIDGIDGRSHYVAIRGDGSIEPLAVGAIVRIASGQSRGCKNNDPQRTLVSDVIVDLLSAVPLHRLPDYDAATWLDRALGNPEVQPRDAGFGREVRKALAMRRLWLVEQGFAWGDEASVTCRPDMIPTLERRELARVARAISQETGLDVVDACDGSRVEGIIRRRLNLASGPFAIVANEREFSLVRWEREFERAIGRQVNGVVRSDGGISWTISRQRGVEI